MVSELLEKMKASVIAEPNHALTLGWRQKLWKEVMERHPADYQWRLAAISYLVCKDNVSAWDKAPFEAIDHRLYQQFRVLCQQVVLGELAAENAWNRYNDLEGLAGMIDYTDNWNAFCALRAIAASCVDAISPPPIPQSINIGLADEDIDPDYLDAHFLTSCIVADGATWEPLSNKEKRQTFWLDWLEKVFLLAFSDRETLLALVQGVGNRNGDAASF